MFVDMAANIEIDLYHEVNYHKQMFYTVVYNKKVIMLAAGFFWMRFWLARTAFVTSYSAVVVNVHATDELGDERLQSLWAHFAHFQHGFMIDSLVVLVAFHHLVSDERKTEDFHATVAGNQHFRRSAHTFKGKLCIY